MLPADWVDQIFARLTVRYGAAWLRMWEGVDLAAVKADWAEELSGLTADSIDHGLAHLPTDRPPNVAQFRELCRRPPDRFPALPAPKPGPIAPEVAAAMRRLVKPKREDPTAWARALMERDRRGGGITRYQRQCYRDALGLDRQQEQA